VLRQIMAEGGPRVLYRFVGMRARARPRQEEVSPAPHQHGRHARMGDGDEHTSMCVSKCVCTSNFIAIAVHVMGHCRLCDLQPAHPLHSEGTAQCTNTGHQQ